MHVDAERASIDLRNPQVDEVDQLRREAGFLYVNVYAAESLVSAGRGLSVVDTIAAHHEVLRFVKCRAGILRR